MIEPFAPTRFLSTGDLVLNGAGHCLPAVGGPHCGCFLFLRCAVCTGALSSVGPGRVGTLRVQTACSGQVSFLLLQTKVADVSGQSVTLKCLRVQMLSVRVCVRTIVFLHAAGLVLLHYRRPLQG